MFTPLKNHLIDLKYLIQCYRDSLTKSSLSTAQRTELHQKIELAHRALDMYVNAYEIEQKLGMDTHRKLSPFLVQGKEKRA